MKNVNKIFLLLYSLTHVAYAVPGNYAYSRGYAPRYSPAPQQSATLTTPNSLALYDVGLGFSYYQYVEPSVMSITGPMFNLYGSVGYVKNLFKFQFDLSYDTYVGANRYKGGLQYENGTTVPYNTNSSDWYISGAGKFGLAFYDKKEVFFVYAGLGYRFLSNLLENQNGISASYHRYQGYLYFPIGMSGEIPLNPKVSLMSALEYRILLFGHNTSTLTDLGYDRDLNFKQSLGYGSRLNIGMRYYITSNYSIKINAYWDFWSIEASNIVSATSSTGKTGNFVEPKNHTNVFGVTLGFSF